MPGIEAEISAVSLTISYNGELQLSDLVFQGCTHAEGKHFDNR